MIEFNTNDYVFVQLTELGKRELQRQHEEFVRKFPQVKFDFTPPEEDSGGWSKWQMHSLMHTFGHTMSCGINPPFETTIKLEA